MIKQITDNVYYYEIQGVRSVTIAFIVGTGPVYEPENLSGISHFIEHVVFRKTKKRNLRQIKLPIEQVGGILNAWTDKENTVYYAKVPSTFFKTAFNILRELVFEPLFTSRNIEIERKIILQEYYSEQEIPEQRLFNKFFENLIDGPHSKPIIGKEETLKSITLDDIVRFHSEMYTPFNVKLIIAGYVEPKNLSVLESLNLTDGFKTTKHESMLKDGIVCDKFSETQQIHFLFSHEGVSYSDENMLYPFMVLNTLLGSGMSSLLFEHIREKKGLVYDISTANIQSRNWGVFSIYAATSPENAENLVKELFNLLKNFKLTKKLFDYGKKRLLGSIELMTESTSALTSLCIQYIANEVQPKSIEEIISKIQQVREEDVQEAFEKVITGQWSLTYVTPAKELNISYEDLNVK
ncbi:MAG: insulinase family protein [Fervidobacterium sp.]|nr:insulinase family protein [Fervidobacterium sp.]